MTKTELKPVLNRQKSYYEKAYIQNNGGGYILTSYDSVVCGVVGEQLYLNKNIAVDLLYSNTTLKHIKDFIYQFYDGKKYTKTELQKVAYLEPFECWGC